MNQVINEQTMNNAVCDTCRIINEWILLWMRYVWTWRQLDVRITELQFAVTANILFDGVRGEMRSVVLMLTGCSKTSGSNTWATAAAPSGVDTPLLHWAQSSHSLISPDSLYCFWHCGRCYAGFQCSFWTKSHLTGKLSCIFPQLINIKPVACSVCTDQWRSPTAQVKNINNCGINIWYFFFSCFDRKNIHIHTCTHTDVTNRFCGTHMNERTGYM